MRRRINHRSDRHKRHERQSQNQDRLFHNRLLLSNGVRPLPELPAPENFISKIAAVSDPQYQYAHPPRMPESAG
jgi:hypothetical protein